MLHSSRRSTVHAGLLESAYPAGLSVWRAALHLQQQLRRYADEMRLKNALNFSVRIGLNSGEVVVGKIGDDLRMDYTAQGHTVGLAARMVQIADPGKALLTGRTAKLVSGYVQLRDLGDTRIKGLSYPLRVSSWRDWPGCGPDSTCPARAASLS
jgi:class 3 adenylate cyclase